MVCNMGIQKKTPRVRPLVSGKYRLGWWQKGMTEKGKAAVVAATLKAPRKFQCDDLVARKEPREDNSDASSFHLYNIVEVPLEHDDVLLLLLLLVWPTIRPGFPMWNGVRDT